MYSVPGSSPSMMWKVLEVFKASDIFQRPSPVQRVNDENGLVLKGTRTPTESNGDTNKNEPFQT